MTLLATLTRHVGRDHVLTSDADRLFYAHDVFRAGELPDAVVRPGTVEACAQPVSSMIGKASISARRPMVGPSEAPLMIATTPERAIPLWISSTPNSRNRSATKPAVS